MTKNPKLLITADGVKDFFERAHEHARKLDRGEELTPEITVSFEDVIRPICGLFRRAAPSCRA